jgi:hypothetical protein
MGLCVINGALLVFYMIGVAQKRRKLDTLVIGLAAVVLLLVMSLKAVSDWATFG